MRADAKDAILTISAPLPPGWAMVPAENVCVKIQDGTHFSPKVQLPSGMYMYVTAKNVRSRGIDLADVTYLREEDHRGIFARCDVREGDVLLVKDGVNAGDTAVNTVRTEISLLSSVCFLRPIVTRLRAGFLRYYLQSPQAVSVLKGNLSGTAIRRIVLNKVRELPVVVAPITEQDSIVAEIEKQFTRLDEAVGALKAVQAKLKRARASVLKAAVEGRLVATEAELARAEGRSQEPASALLERILAERRARWPKGKKYEPPAEPKTDDLPDLSEGWAWASLDQLSTLVRNGYGKKPAEHGVTRILRISAVRPGSVDPRDCRWLPEPIGAFSEATVHPGELLFTRYNGTRALVGVCGMLRTAEPVVHPDKLIRVVPVASLVSSAYVEKAANVGASRAFIESRVRTTAGQAGVSGADIKHVPVPLPPLSEQLRIAAEVERRLSVIDNLERTVEQSLARCTRLRQSILKRAFEGKLVHQDPSDEPAARLLERIREARGSTARSSGKQAHGSRVRAAAAASAGAGRRR